VTGLPETSRRSPRSDGLKNRASVQAAARTILASAGTAASLSDIAARAGVSKGTILRHYPTKDDLVTEITLETLAELLDRVTAVRDEPEPGMALRRMMSEILRLQERDRNFCDVVADAASLNAPVARAVADIAAVVDDVTRRARQAGSLAPDVTGRDVVALTNGIHHAVQTLANGDDADRERYLSIVLGGLTR
jgi:AcrR family transcriptional regulator